MAVVVNPSETSTLGSRTTHLAVLHHVAGGKLVEVARGKVDAQVRSDEDEEGENEHDGLHVWEAWEMDERVALTFFEASFLYTVVSPDYHQSSRIAACSTNITSRKLQTEPFKVCLSYIPRLHKRMC